MKYDFTELNDIEFEELVNKLLTGKTSIVEQYCQGKDGGADGITRRINKGTIIQAKHYQKSGFSALKSIIKNKELDKIKKRDKKSYLLATSIDLSFQQAEELRKIINTVVSNVIIIGYEVIKNLLDNDVNTLKSTMKLWTLSTEIVKHILKPEDISRFIELQTRWQDINKVFVETPDVEKVIEIINEKHVAIIAGAPGVGKTTLAEFLCMYFFKEGFEIQIFEGDFSREQYDLSNRNKKILYYFDDFLGSNYLNCIADKSDTAIVNFINQISNEKNKRFILTSRINIINKAYEYSQAYRDYHLNRNNHIVNVGDYDEMTKGKILYNHLWHSDINLIDIKELILNQEYKNIITHHNFNPRLIQFITRSDNFKESNLNYLTFIKQSLENPTQLWEQCFTAQLNDSQRLVVKLVVANGGLIDEIHLKKAYNAAFNLLQLQRPIQELYDYEYIMRICLKSILNKNHDIKTNISTISVFNPSVTDYIIPILLTNESELLILCKVLRSVESVRFIKSQEMKIDTKKIYDQLLHQYDDDEWSECKILLVGLLNKKELLYDFAKNHNNYECITKNNATVMYNMVIDTINDIDWSDFLTMFCNKICDTNEEYNEIYYKYNKCPYMNPDTLDSIHGNLIDEIFEYFEDELIESDGFYECYFAEDVKQHAKEYLNNLKTKISCLTDVDIETILNSIDAEKLAEDNIERNQDYDIEYQRHDDLNNIDQMFARFLETT